MICPKCKTEEKGKYCSHCGMWLGDPLLDNDEDTFRRVEFELKAKTDEDTAEAQASAQQAEKEAAGTKDADGAPVSAAEEKTKAGTGEKVLRYDFRMNSNPERPATREDDRRNAGEKRPEEDGDDPRDERDFREEEDGYDDRYEDEYDDRYEDDDYDDRYDDDPDYDEYEEGYDRRNRAPRYEDEDDYEEYRDRNKPFRGESAAAGAARKVAGGASVAGAAAGKAVGNGFRKVWGFIFTLLQWISALLMLAVGAQVGWTFWKERATARVLMADGLNNNMALLVFAGTVAVMLLYALIQIIWIMTRPIDYDGRGGYRRIDTGRGTLAFFLFLFAALASLLMVHLLPESNDILRGVKAVTEVLKNLGTDSNYLICCAAGIVICCVRRLRGLFG